MSIRPISPTRLPQDLAGALFEPDTSRRLAVLRDKPIGALMIHEIYRSIQGESTFAGLPCVFVRLTACHLRCGYCDTPHAFRQGESLRIESVIERVIELGDPLVEITGGEPLLQPEVFPLMTELADRGRAVLLETSGACDISNVDPRVHIIMDLKTPGSGECAANLWANVPLLKSKDELKFVVCDRADFDWAVARVREHSLCDRLPVLVSPVFGSVSALQLAEWILATRLPLRMQLQQHKLIWPADQRGV